MGGETSAFTGDLFFHVSVYATRENRANWGDTQYAEGLLRALRAIPGCGGALLFRNETPALVAGRDVVLRIIGPHAEDPLAGVPNLMWMISPPNFAASAMLARYQTVFCASQLFTAYLAQHGVDAVFMPQATETGHFHPDRRRADAAEIPVAFVGAYAARADRRLVLQAIKAGHDVRIWGPGWEGVVPDRCLQGKRLTYTELAETYAAARVVLNSHMPQMAELGFMSNRSFDALASGARVISEQIPGFFAPHLSDLACVANAEELGAQLDAFLTAPVADHSARMALHERTARAYGFHSRATAFVAAARAHLAAGRIAPSPLELRQTLPRVAAGPITPDLPADTQEAAVLQAAREILRLARACPDVPSAPADDRILHPLMPHLREMRDLMQTPVTAQTRTRVEDLAAIALRLTEVLAERAPGLAMNASPASRGAVLARLIRNQPSWAHDPEEYHRDHNKVHLALRPRREAVALETPIGVFLHLYYHDLAKVFAQRLALIDAPHRLYVSTDTDKKAAEIARHLPQAEVRVAANRGRDIWPKLYGFAEAYDRHEVVLHLHGKKSRHSEKLDDWLGHILNCLLGSREEINRILSMFQAIPRLGLVTPLAFRSVLSAAHWGANEDIARELAFRMKLPAPLPDNARLRFPVGSMFWGRTKAIRPLVDLNLAQDQFPPEVGQVDGTLAHAIERMLGVTCEATGHVIVPVSGASSSLHSGFRHRFRSNRDLREALKDGFFKPT